MKSLIKFSESPYHIWIVLITLCFMGTSTYAQPSDYQRLAFRSDQPNIYIDVFTLPGASEDDLKLTAIFNISNNFLSFRKLNSASREADFYASGALNIEVFRSPENDLKPFEDVNIERLSSVGRAAWRDTAYAADYEATQSSDLGVSGAMQVDLSPGHYTYMMQFNQDDNQRSRNSQTRNIHLSGYSQQKRYNVLFAEEMDGTGDQIRLNLMNLGSNVRYGQDFYGFIHLPDYNESANYSIKIDRVEYSRDDTTQISTVLEQQLQASEIRQNIRPQLVTDRDQPALMLPQHNNGYTYALVKIPNSRFPNASYRLTVESSESSRPVASRIFQSLWSDMPVSLLSLDVAIDMLRFITDDATIDRIDDGSDRSRERKFREFWKEKDPTPDTEYNELQAEYYERIDYAYENFGSQNLPGYDSDRGRIYINYGPPNDVKRTFPTNDATTEVWTYNNRRFVFKATSGFGDFKLVSKTK